MCSDYNYRNSVFTIKHRVSTQKITKHNNPNLTTSFYIFPTKRIMFLKGILF